MESPEIVMFRVQRCMRARLERQRCHAIVPAAETFANFRARIHSTIRSEMGKGPEDPNTGNNVAIDHDSPEWQRAWWNSLQMAARTASGDLLIVVFSPKPKVHIDTARTLMDCMQAKGIKQAIIMSYEELTPKAKEEFLAFRGGVIRHLKIGSCTFDLLRVHDMPSFRKLSRDEKAALGDNFYIDFQGQQAHGVQFDQRDQNKRYCPEMLVSDPVATCMALRVGDVVEVRRKYSGMNEVSYRLVK